MTTQRGFTIVELILFLGITGALFAALIVGVNSSIGQQRYKESVVSYKALLEDQYSQVIHPQNGRDDKWTCDSTGGVAQAPNGGQARGTTDCVLLGRYIQVKDNGSKIETGDVIGIQPVDSSSLTNDILALAAYEPTISPINSTEDDVQWQSVLQSIDRQPSSASFLILRSPLSGLLRTFALSEPLPARLADAITPAAASLTLKNCIVPNGSIGMPVQSVSVAAPIASANGIVINGVDDQC
jgi:type II secretory pathway pseudopilin PulG